MAKKPQHGTNGGAPLDVPDIPPQLQTHMMAIGDVRRYTANPRRKQNVDKIAASLKRYGWRQPIVIDRDHVIIVGDTRYLGARSLGMTHVPVWIAADMTEAEAKGYRIADNRLAEESEWDEALVEKELELLQQLGVIGVELEIATGFDQDELESYLGTGEATHTLQPVDVEKFPPFTWVLIGIGTERYIEIAELIEKVAAIPEAFVEVSANEERP